MATVSAVLYTSKKYAGKGEPIYPIMIRVQHRSSKKYFKVGDDTYNVTERQWDDNARELKRDKRVNANYIEQNFYILEQVNKLLGIIKDFEKNNIAWTLNLLEQKYNGDVNYINFVTITESKIQYFEERDKTSSADGYRAMIKSLISIFGEKKIKKLEVADVDYAFVDKIITYARKEVNIRGKVRQRWKDGFIYVRLTQIKAILNFAIRKNMGSPATYPFGDKYGATEFIRTTDFKRRESRKKYIPKNFMERFKNHKCYNMHRMSIVKCHIFQKLLNDEDIGYQKMIQIRQHSIKRKKINGKFQNVLVLTEAENGIDRVIAITKEMQIILDWFEEHATPLNDYIFPIIKQENSSNFKKYLYDQARRRNSVIWELMKEHCLPACFVDTFDTWNELEIFNFATMYTHKIFLFSYYAHGINLRDMANLKTYDVMNGYNTKNGHYKYIAIARKKTRAPLEIPISSKIQGVLDWFKENTPSHSDYLLPIVYKPELTGTELYRHISHQIGRFNRNLKTLAKDCGFPGELEDLHLYFARHTYATTTRKNGAGIEKIAQALGHIDINTTKVYLESFEHSEINKYNEML
ncbi:MAG: tyrosine-type recombinase/integrase [Bacteroidales bacterium]|nr:tyrosine-type recombinase/integrase [Bacteroidales bacterium]